MGRQASYRRLLAPLLAAAVLLLCSGAASALQAGQTCALDRNCDAGLHCETCVADGNVRPRCTRVTPVDPQTKVRGRCNSSPGSLSFKLKPLMRFCPRRRVTCRSTGTRG
jgi:hypothetical protein